MDLTNQVKKFGTYPGKLLKFKQVSDMVRVCALDHSLWAMWERREGGVTKKKTTLGGPSAHHGPSSERAAAGPTQKQWSRAGWMATDLTKAKWEVN